MSNEASESDLARARDEGRALAVRGLLAFLLARYGETDPGALAELHEHLSSLVDDVHMEHRERGISEGKTEAVAALAASARDELDRVFRLAAGMQRQPGEAG